MHHVERADPARKDQPAGPGPQRRRQSGAQLALPHRRQAHVKKKNYNKKKQQQRNCRWVLAPRVTRLRAFFYFLQKTARRLRRPGHVRFGPAQLGRREFTGTGYWVSHL